jgi:hypothetical protein
MLDFHINNLEIISLLILKKKGYDNNYSTFYKPKSMDKSRVYGTGMNISNQNVKLIRIIMVVET